ncbi:MAG: PAS domain S-box protein [Hyphomicrobiales bacterium]|nr:PAS domain S-box protein [Hyphomicrobiales bacterium]
MTDVGKKAEETFESILSQRSLGLDAETEKRLHEVLHALPAAVYTTDALGRITFYNEAAAAFWGCRPVLGSDQWCGSWRLYRPDGTPLPHNECPMALAIERKRPVLGMEAIAERPDGTHVPFMPYPTPLFDSAGALVGAVNMLVDITENKRAEETARRAEQDLRDFLERANVAIHWVDPDGTLLWANRAELDMLGYAREDYVGHHVAEFHVDRHAADDILRRLGERERLTDYAARLRRKDGSIRHVLINSSVFSHNGEFVGCFTRDITENKRSAEASRLLAAIVEGSDDAIVSKDLNGIITSWNKGAERIFGYLAEEVIGKSITILIPPDRLHEEPAILDRVRRGERVDHYETIRRRKHGALIDISLTVSPVRDETGRIVGASKIARDITERKRSEAQIAMLAREAEHRAKNVLASVQATVRLSTADTAVGLKRAIEGRIQALANVHRLFAETRWAGADLHSLIKDELAAYANEQETRVTIEGATLLLEPMTAQAIAVTVHELATNAAKYGALSSPSGCIRVQCSRAVSGQLTLRWIETNGPPVKPPTHMGFGSRIMEGMIRGQLQGEFNMDWRGNGLVCEIAIPV